MKLRKTYFKKGLAAIGLAIGLTSMASGQLVFELTDEYTGAAQPVAAGPGAPLVATFEDSSTILSLNANEVQLTLDASNLLAGQKITSWSFNFGKDLQYLTADPTSATETKIVGFDTNSSGHGSTDPYDPDGIDMGGSPGHGFDFKWDYQTSGNVFGGGQTLVMTLTWDDFSVSPTLTTEDFNLPNQPGGGPGAYYSAAHVQSITGDPNGDSGWIAGAGVIPEPSTYALIFGGVALGVVVLRKKLRKEPAKA